MGTLSLKCPLCCNEEFSSRQLLRDHIVEIINNVVCPTCHTEFSSVIELADHLKTDCETNLPTPENIKQEFSDENVEPDQPEEEETYFDTEHAEIAKTNDLAENYPSGGDEDDESGVTYMCVMCDVQFKSIEEHLDKYHDGEEVVLETEEVENETQEISDENQAGEYVQEQDKFELVQESESTENVQYIEEEENSNTEKPDIMWRMQKVNIAPFTENYMVENGKVKKITEEEVAEIKDRNSIIQIHQCPKCYLQFPKLDHYIKHHCFPKKTGKRYKCVHCLAIFQSHQSLNSHLKIHYQQSDGTPTKVITLSPHTCDTCNTIFPSFKSLRLHKRMHDPVKTKAVESPVTQKISDGDDPSPQTFVCQICNNSYDMEYEQIHMKSHSGEDDFFCTICNRKFFTKENLDMHMKAHSNTKKFSCSYCKKAFITYAALHEHVTNQCQNRQYECQYCGRRFSRPHEKVKHERIHTGEKPHVCQICGKAFRVSYCLTLHMRTHSGSRPYECPHCNKRFKSHSVYNHHLLIHSDVRAYKCPYCPKAFKTSVQLAGHKNSHIKPFNCTECNRPFASLYAVRAHMETHKRENNLKFDCWLCGATYARAFALKDHMKSQHAGENVSEVIVDMDTEETDENCFPKKEVIDATEHLLGEAV